MIKSSIAFLALFIISIAPLSAWHFVPPSGVGIANVKDYGAKGDGETDDTQAILEAISDNIDKSRYRSNPFIWFPDGTYIVSDSIEGRVIGKRRDQGGEWSAGWRSMLILIGETRDGVVIKLKDKAPGFTDPEILSGSSLQVLSTTIRTTNPEAEIAHFGTISSISP